MLLYAKKIMVIASTSLNSGNKKKKFEKSSLAKFCLVFGDLLDQIHHCLKTVEIVLLLSVFYSYTSQKMACIIIFVE